MRQHMRPLMAILGALAISACSHLPDLPNLPGPATQAESQPMQGDHVRNAITLLGQGDPARARVELRAVLAERPDHTVARRLMEQLDAEPETLLAGPARAYTVRAGETLSQIAERFQGDRLLFYALARYNNIAAPDQVSAGQALMVPRRPGLPAPQPQQQVALRDFAPVETPVAAAAPPPRAESSRANALRLQALQRLNAGQVDGAVALLRQAIALDANNTVIQRDLDRALRLQASLRNNG